MLRRAELAGAVDDRLYFAQVREDPQLELAAFKGHWDGPIAVVSSAGCTALSLLAEGADEVVGIDVNRTQNHLVELKAAAVARLEPDDALALLGGAPLAPGERLRSYRRVRDALTPAAQRYWDARPGVVARGVLHAGVTERLMRLIAGCVRRLVHPRGRVDRLLALRSLDEQREFYRREWDNARWRLLFRVLCNRLMLRRTYHPAFFDHVEDASYAAHFRRVAEHTLTTLPVSDNYFLHHMLTGSYPDGSRPPYLTNRVADDRLTLVDGSFTDYLRTRPDGSLAGFALSNICEWLTAEQIDELFAEIVRTARPGARLVFRNFVGWTEVPKRWQEQVCEDRALGEDLMRLDRSLCQRRFAVCEVRRR
jgi:S-adenosylmethionine-diacylglycerol 3-amino-3-carboxypropyl transferase